MREAALKHYDENFDYLHFFPPMTSHLGFGWSAV